MKRKILIIHNPKAGQKKKVQLHSECIKWSKNKLQFDYIETEYGGHGTEITKKAIEDNYDIVAAAGGDGTVNEIATALVNSKTALGIIPMGSGNGLARHNHIPLNLEKSFLNLFSGKVKKIDSGLINEKHFFCAAGIGFDAHVSNIFANSKTRGLSSYVSISLKEYFKYNPKNYQIQIGKKSFNKKSFLITFANSNQFGNNAFIAPQAKIDDGILEICSLSPFRWWNGFPLAFRLFSKTIQKSKFYESFSSKHLKITTDEKINFHYDGENMKIDSNKIEISIIPKALNIIVP